MSGVEIVQADLDDDLDNDGNSSAALVSALTGASAIFCNTDFFTPIYAAMATAAATPPPPSAATATTGAEHEQDEEDKKAADSILQHAYNREITQNLTVARAASSPAVLATLERFVLSTLPDARALSKGKFTNVYHFDSKAEVERRIKAEFPGVAERMSGLLVGHYTSNWTAVPVMYPQKQQQEQPQIDGGSKQETEGEEGEDMFTLTRPFSPTTLVPFINAARDTGEFVRALVLDLPAGTTLLGASEIMTFPEFAALWGATLGRKAEYRQLQPAGGVGAGEVFLSSVPSPLRQEIGASFDFWEECGYWGGDGGVVLPGQVCLSFFFFLFG